ncbi:hypothetical protein SLS62_010212 [Diatrype stigma]|uniref:Uncharacterized protein n=1 Tax=Diatrype stigma TaxID=117547 RepID=A0AAN9UB48_9PEZI
MATNTVRFNTPTGTSSYPVQELPGILKQLTVSDFREVVLALCFPGTRSRGYTKEVYDILEKLDAERGRTSHQDGLPMHLFDLTKHELEVILLAVSAQKEGAYQRVLLVTEKIIATKVRWY